MEEIEWNGRGKLTLTTGKRFTIILKREFDLVIYGNGYDFDFSIFAESLKNRILSKNKSLTVDTLRCVTKKDFLDILLNLKKIIRLETYIFFPMPLVRDYPWGMGLKRR